MKQISDISRNCESLNEVYSALGDINEDKDGKWVFRGVEDVEYGLTPTVFRQPDIVKSWLGVSEPYPRDIIEQIRNELRLLHKYFSAANFIGLQIPGNWQYVLDQTLVNWEPHNIQSGGCFKNQEAK